MDNVPGASEAAIFSPKHDVYPLIDPATLFAKQAYKDNVVLITGASTGIGAKTAEFYARAGANLVLVSRSRSKLDEHRATIRKEVPNARVELVAGDVADYATATKAVKAAVDSFGKLDIVIANAAGYSADPRPLAEQDPAKWWYTQEVNLRGTFNFVHASIPELVKTHGQVIATTTLAAHLRLPVLNDYSISKHGVNRFIEVFSYEYPDIKAYAVHPGVIATPGAVKAIEQYGFPGGIKAQDTVELPSATFLWLTARNAEFLSGRYIHAPWDLNEVIAAKDEIVRENSLVTKLAGLSKSA